MISKVKSVQANGTFDSQYGTLYKFDYEMEDGTFLSANHKSQTPFAVGAEVEYEIKGTNERGNYGGVSKPKDSNYSQGSKKSNIPKPPIASFALSYAKDLAVAGKITEQQLLVTADKFHNWLKENS